MKLGDALTGAATITLFGVAAAAALAPDMMARQFGIPVTDGAGRAYVRALGARDGAIGAIVVALWSGGHRSTLATSLAVTTLLAASDLALVIANEGPATSRAIHATGAAGLIAAAVLVALDA